MEVHFTDIEIENFRLYRDKQRAELNDGSSTGFTLFVGYEPEIMGGVGKSTLLKAVSLCLRGGPYQSIGKWNLINEERVESLSDGERDSGEIRMKVEHGDTEYRATRKVYTEKDGKSYRNEVGRLRVEEREDGGWRRNRMRGDEILPESADEYSLVHPEYVSDFEVTREHIETLTEKVKETQEKLGDIELSKKEVWREILDKTKKYFDEFSPEDISVVDDGDYRIKFDREGVLDKHHSEDSTNNLLAFSILLAAASSGSVETPQIFDSPFIWMDDQTRINIYEKLPEVDHQVAVIASEGTIPSEVDYAAGNSYWIKLERGDYDWSKIEAIE